VLGRRVDQDVAWVLRVDPARAPDDLAAAVRDWLGQLVELTRTDPSGLNSLNVRLLNLIPLLGGPSAGSLVRVAAMWSTGLLDPAAVTAAVANARIWNEVGWFVNAAVGGAGKTAADIPRDSRWASHDIARKEQYRRHFFHATQEWLATLAEDGVDLLQRTARAQAALAQLARLPESVRPAALRDGRLTVLLDPATDPDQPLMVLPWDTRPGQEPAVEAALAARLHAGSQVLVAVPAPAGTQLPRNLTPNGVYTVTAVEKGIVYLSNAAGAQHPDPLSVREFLDLVYDEYVTVVDRRLAGLDWSDPAFDMARLSGVAAADLEAAIPADWERIGNSPESMTYRYRPDPGRQITVLPGQAGGPDPTSGPHVQLSTPGWVSAPVPLAGNPALAPGSGL
jgi:hypothetical protein